MTQESFLQAVGNMPRTNTERMLLESIKGVRYFETIDGVAYEVDCGQWGHMTNDGRGGGTWFRPSLKFVKLYNDKRHEIDEIACERLINAYEKVGA